jgi:hypothetical protein
MPPAAQLRLTLLLHLVEAHSQDMFEPTGAEARKAIIFRTTRGMQRLTDGERHLGSIGVESDPAQLAEVVGACHAFSQTQIPQDAVRPSEQPLLAFRLGAGVLLGTDAKFYYIIRHFDFAERPYPPLPPTALLRASGAGAFPGFDLVKVEHS